MKETILTWVNRVLMYNLFFVLFAFLWFAIALIGRSFDIPLGFDLWYRLWEPVFTPAIGLLMGGAILSGIISWVNRQFNPEA